MGEETGQVFKVEEEVLKAPKVKLQLGVAGLTIIVAGGAIAAISTRGASLHRDPPITETAATTASTPTPMPTPIPSYVAEDYNTPGRHPPLTRDQTAAIQKVLARVKPCQRSLVRYVLWQYEKDGIAFFFAPGADSWAHILGEPDGYFTPMDGVFAGPPDSSEIQAQKEQGIQWDIDRQPCPQQ